MAVSPLDEAVGGHLADLGEGAEPGEGGVTLEIDIVEQALKNIPGSKPQSQFVGMTKNQGGKVELTSTDLRKEQRVAGRKKRDPFPDWASVLREAATNADVTRVCLDRRRLQALLKAVDDASGRADQEAVVYIEVGGDTDAVLLRAENRVTGQRVVGMMSPMQTRGKWLRPSAWERRVLGRGPKKKRSEE
jgi:hypothetical protein